LNSPLPKSSKGGEVEGLQVLINALVVTGVGVILAAMTHGLRREVREDVAQLRSDISDVRAEMREMRSDLTRVALAIGAERRAGSQ
jgi:hypothetical protein